LLSLQLAFSIKVEYLGTVDTKFVRFRKFLASKCESSLFWVLGTTISKNRWPSITMAPMALCSAKLVSARVCLEIAYPGNLTSSGAITFIFFHSPFLFERSCPTLR
jgi:hypothetical protein